MGIRVYEGSDVVVWNVKDGVKWKWEIKVEEGENEEKDKEKEKNKSKRKIKVKKAKEKWSKEDKAVVKEAEELE